jgi:hypothetical protein
MLRAQHAIARGTDVTFVQNSNTLWANGTFKMFTIHEKVLRPNKPILSLVEGASNATGELCKDFSLIGNPGNCFSTL